MRIEKMTGPADRRFKLTLSMVDVGEFEAFVGGDARAMKEGPVVAFNPTYLTEVMAGMETDDFVQAPTPLPAVKPVAMVSHFDKFSVLRALMPVRVS